MRFTPKTRQEIEEMGLLQDGQYNYEVIKAEDAVSKTSGVEMIKLQLRVYDANDKPHLVFDYLLESMAFKLIHFCESTGLFEKYNAGNLVASDCLGKKGALEIIIQNDKSGRYSASNSVKDYVVAGEKINGVPVDSAPPAFEDDKLDMDIPF